MYYNSRFLVTIIIVRKKKFLQLPTKKKMRTYLLLFASLLLIWQGFTITSTLGKRLEQKATYINSILSEYNQEGK